MKLIQNEYAVIFQNMKSESNGLTNSVIPTAPWNAIQQKKEQLSPLSRDQTLLVMGQIKIL